MCALACGATAQALAHIRHSTHDWTAPTGIPSEVQDFREFWADVKTPGDGFAYAVGTITVKDTRPTAQFSLAPASPSFGSEFLLTNLVRQVVLLQQTRTDDHAIQAQRFFFGSSPQLSSDIEESNARGISVWPAASLQDTRVVICGETYDKVLPLSQAPAGFPAATGGNATGFIAVYDGNLTLKWTHHLFGTNANGECAVTDVTVRVVDGRDVITYCGISTFGNPSSGNQSLTPVLPFLAPSPTCFPGTRAFANGATDNGVGQWDGFVGRVSRDHANTTSTSIEFHSVVGGSQQDGLFGIAELPDGQFAVVGSTEGTTTSSGTAFPGLCVTSTDVYCVGVAIVFDATPVASNNLLLYQSFSPIGAVGENHTILRDVVAQPGPHIFSDNVLVVAGSTDDLHLEQASGPISLTIATPFAGPTDGFVVAMLHFEGIPGSLQPYAYTFQGANGNSGFTGVAAWNEYADHVVAAGFWAQPGSVNSDIDVASYYLYTAGYLAPPSSPDSRGVYPLTVGQLAGTSDDHPTAMGPAEVTQGNAITPTFDTHNLGNHAGGGVAQDAMGRVQVVGTTRSIDFPVIGTGRVRSTFLAPPGDPTFEDGVRIVLDLLPAGVGRTDGTGATPSLAGLTFPMPGTDGGTTPPCDLAPFGVQIGTAPPAQRRLLIAFEGPPPASGTPAGIIVARAPNNTAFAGAALQVGFPGTIANMPILLNGLEAWCTSSLVFFYLPQPNAVFRDVIPALPPGPAKFTIQVSFLLSTPVTAGNPKAGVPCGGTDVFVASPALFLDY